VSINIKNAPVKEVLKQLTKQTGYNFICDADIINAAGPVTLNAKNTELKKVLDECFAKDLVEIVAGENNTIVIRKKTLVVKPIVVAAITITGKVTDSKGKGTARRNCTCLKAPSRVW
jgi:type II secretory pathway component GspD/PulD (secretin)